MFLFKNKYLHQSFIATITLLLVLNLGCKSLSAQKKSDIKVFDEIINDIKSGNYGETHSFIVYKDDKLLVEKYFRGYSADKLHYQYSVTKSVASILIGIAIDKGYIKSTEKPLLSFFPSYKDIKNNDERKKAIKLKDVLTMRAGFKWDEWTHSYYDRRNDANKLIRSNDLISFMLDLPMAQAPNEQFRYNSGCSMLLSGIIQNTTKKTTEEFAREHLFEPLGVKEWKWETGKDGLFNTGWGLHLKPLDMAKIGLMVKNKGVANGKRIVSEKWINTSLQNYGRNYGYQWWLSGNDSSYSARGFGGQFIFVLPKKNIVMVTTAGNFRNSSNPSGLIMAEKIKQHY